jgi:short-subunit dehydrogenase
MATCLGLFMKCKSRALCKFTKKKHMTQQFSSKSLVVITGGTKGIGRALVERFAAGGYDVATCSRNQKDLEVLKTAIESSYPVQCHIKQADLGQTEACNEFARFVKQLNKPLAAIVHNAAIFRVKALMEESQEELQAMLQTNVISAHILNRQLLPVMIERQQGHLFFIASVASLRGFDNCGAYVTAKHALLGMARALREELKPLGLKVTTVMPGATYTNSWAGIDIDQKRLMPPTDIAEAVWAAFSFSARSVVEEIVIRPQLGDL